MEKFVKSYMQTRLHYLVNGGPSLHCSRAETNLSLTGLEVLLALKCSLPFVMADVAS